MDLETAYAYPPGTDRWVRANMVVSVDGSASLDHQSATLSGTGDKKVFGLLRALCDVILVGAGTARIEEYAAVRIGPTRAEIRDRHGLSASPPIAVVTRTLDLDLTKPLFTQAAARTIVVTTSSVPSSRLAAAREVADVIVHDGEIDLARLLDQLADRGLRRVLTEGGPALLGDLLSAGLVDELCLTISPTMVGDPGEKRLTGRLPEPLALELVGTISDAGFVFLRYLVRR
ncbi:pyrimidine reductase family protein [Acidothermaceae bacterium B102]|nr:pyrimidine reductase family protein [Acidothermaceae bacterium B102]